MTGQIRKVLDDMIEKVSAGNQVIKTTTKTKLILKGINPDNYDENSYDDPAVMDKIKEVAKEFHVEV